MAAIVRRTWPLILAEVIRRLKGITATGFDARVQHWIWAVYQEMALRVHHFELDTSAQLTCSTTENRISLPTDCFILMGAVLRNTDAPKTFLANLVGQHYSVLFASYKGTAGVPSKWSRFGSRIYFDVKPALAYFVDISYYKQPAAPDFAGSGSPEFATDCDMALIEMSVALGMAATAAPDLSEASKQIVDAWVSSQQRPMLLDYVDRKEVSRASMTLGGAQG